MSFKSPFSLGAALVCGICSGQVVVEEWSSVTFGPSSSSTYEAEAVIQTTDGGFITVGRGSHYPTSFIPSFRVLRYDQDGNVLWEQYYGDKEGDWAHAICQSSDGGFIIAGTTLLTGGVPNNPWQLDDVSNHLGGIDIWILKINSAGVIEWEETYGGSDQDEAFEVIETLSGDILVVGSTESDDVHVSGHHGYKDGWVMQLDPTGGIMWSRAIGGSSNEEFLDVVQTNSNEFVIVGYTLSDDGDLTGPNPNTSLWLVSMDTLGNIIGQQTLGGSQVDMGAGISLTVDGGYVVAGRSNSTDGDVTGNNGDDDFWVLRFDNSGNILWQKSFGGSDEDIAVDVIETAIGDLIVAGNSSSVDGDVSSPISGSDGWIVGLDSMGTLLWERSCGGSQTDFIRALHPTADGGFVMVGTAYSKDGDIQGHSPGLGSNFWTMKFRGNANLVSGKVFIDFNSNQIQEVGEPPLPAHVVELLGSGNSFHTLPDGSFNIPVLDTGAWSVSAGSVLNYNGQPNTHSGTFPDIDQSVDSLNDFAMQPAVTFNDLELTITPLTPFRPGFAGHYVVDYRNTGTTTLAPNIYFIQDDKLTFNSSSIAPSNIYPDSVHWQLAPLSPFGQGQIMVHFTVDITTPIGTVLTSEARIDPVLGDAAPASNFSSWQSTVTASFDPNDILVDRSSIQLSELNPTPPDLNYIIRFQNTGTDTAFTVRIENDFPENADLSTFRFVASSDPVQINYMQHVDRFEFRFDNILLPDSNVNEPESHGFIRYTIKPKSTLLLGDSILNTAGIYFDFNSPIITNTAYTVIENTTEVGGQEGIGFSVTPNPSNGLVSVRFEQMTEGTLIITDALGREVRQFRVQGQLVKIDLSDQATGLFNITLQDDAGGMRSTKLLLE